ncbi:MAG: hypothetical protein AMXMBFR36_04530 [Acidobacteriota bacterium]
MERPPAPVDDAAILELARAGARSEAIAAFDAAHGARLAALCRRLTGSVADGEDAWQETLIQVDRSLPAFRGESSLATWAFRIATNVCLNRRRGLAARATHVELESGAGALAAGPADGGDPDAGCVSSFRAWVVEKALLGLPEGQRAAITLHDLEEMTAAEVGALLGIEANAVKQRVHRARRSLRERIAREFGARGIDLDGVGVEGCVSGLFADDAPGADRATAS